MFGKFHRLQNYLPYILWSSINISFLNTFWQSGIFCWFSYFSKLIISFLWRGLNWTEMFRRFFACYVIGRSYEGLNLYQRNGLAGISDLNLLKFRLCVFLLLIRSFISKNSFVLIKNVFLFSIFKVIFYYIINYWK